MPDHSTNIDVRTSWRIHTLESWNAQQRILADSISDTARMARNTLSLVLLVAIYMSLTLFVSDKEILLDKQVVIPQTNIGISIRTSYVVTPLIFLYLHAQVLFLLSVLTQKIQRFISASNTGPPVTNLVTRSLTRSQGGAEESWDWLSAFIFVQSFTPNGSRRCLPWILSCISIVVFPILLLLLIDLQFIRYQHIWITLLHHAILTLDVMLIVFLFTSRILQMQRTNSVTFSILAALLTGGGLLSYSQLPKFSHSEIENKVKGIWRSNETTSPAHAVLCNFLELCRYIDVNKELLTNTWVELPDYVFVELRDKDSESKQLSTNRLDLADRTLRYACFRSSTLYGVDFISSDLRGADFGSAYIYHSDFSRAKLHGVNFIDAKLDGIDLASAKLHYTNLSGAELRGVDFRGAELHGANLSKSKSKSKSEGILSMRKCVKPAASEDRIEPDRKVTYRGTNDTKLHGADFRFAELHDVNLEGAELYGSDLRNAKLRGVNLKNAKLNGADLRNVQLDGADLGGATLDGADLRGADLRNAELAGRSGQPKSQKFVLRDSLQFISSDRNEEFWEEFSKLQSSLACRNKYIAKMILKRWGPDDSLPDMESQNLETRRCIIIRALEKARQDLKKWQCPGLHAVTDDEWYESGFCKEIDDGSSQIPTEEAESEGRESPGG